MNAKYEVYLLRFKSYGQGAKKDKNYMSPKSIPQGAYKDVISI